MDIALRVRPAAGRLSEKLHSSGKNREFIVQIWVGDLPFLGTVLLWPRLKIDLR